MDKIINVGLAGFGTSGKVFNAPFINADSRFNLKKCYERSTSKCAEEYPYVETVHDFEELLTDDIDLVVIALPNQLHVPMAKLAIESGKNVLVEKPVAATAAEAEELCLLAHEKGVFFSVNQNRRFDGDFLTVKKIIESGVLGRIVDYKCNYERFVPGASSKAWKVAGGYGVDILYDLGIHILDQVYYLFGMPDSVYADLRKLKEVSSGIDAFTLNLYYPDDLVVTLTATETAAIRLPHYDVNGMNGSFVKYGMDVQEEMLRQGKRPPSDDWGKDYEDMYGTLSLYEDGELHEKKVETETGNYGFFYDDVYKALTTGCSPLVTGEQAADVLRIVEAAQRSNTEGRRIIL